MRRYSRSFQRGSWSGCVDLGRWPLVQGGQDVQGLRVVLDQVGEVAAGAGHRHDRSRQRRVGVEAVDAVGLIARQLLERVARATGAADRSATSSSSGESTPPVWSIPAPASLAAPLPAGSLDMCPGCVSRCAS